MTTYTGANLKARTLIALAENPVDTHDSGNLITVNPAMNEFTIHFSLSNISYSVAGVLPMTDMPHIQAALESNRRLQKLWTMARIDDTGSKVQFLALDSQVSALTNERCKKRNAVTAVERSQIQHDVLMELAQPGLAKTPNLTRYLESIRDRAQAISGITRAEEVAAFEATDAWQDTWIDYIEQHGQTPLQQSMLRGFRALSDARVLLYAQSIGTMFPRIGDARRIFTSADLEHHISFTNDMAYKRAFFLPAGFTTMVRTTAAQDRDRLQTTESA